MALNSNEGELNLVDNALQRQGNGTVTGSHQQNFGTTARNLTQIVRPFDPRLQYFGGALGGTWTLSIAGPAWYRFGSFQTSATPGAAITLDFSGTAISVFGFCGPNGGKFDAYIDGQLYNGLTLTQTYIPATIPAGQQVPPSNNQIAPFSSTATTLTVPSTAGFVSTGGIIRIDQEQIYYSSMDATNFSGLIRGYNGTVAATHQEGTPVILLNSANDTYLPTTAFRLKLWSADDLPSGSHTLALVIRPDKNAASTNTRLIIDSFAIGAVLGGSNINLHTIQANYGTILTDGGGKYGLGSPNISNSAEQLVGILGVYDDSYSLRYQMDPNHFIWFYGAPNTTYTNVTLTMMMLGASI